MTLRLRTFGVVCLERDGVPLGGAHTQRRRLATLAYLAASARTPVSRQKLIALLWPDSDEASGRHSLSQMLYALRHDLGADALRVDQETVTLDPAVLESDVHSFDDALRAKELERAVGEYQGPFLDGVHFGDAPEMDRWIDSERAHRAGQCAKALERLATDAEAAGDWHRAREWWLRLAAMDPTDGRVTLRLMQSHVAIGDRRGAMRAASVYETVVRQDLEAEPDRAVKQLADKLRADRGPELADTASAARAPQPVSPPSPPDVNAGLPIAEATPAEPAVHTVARASNRKWIALVGAAAVVAGGIYLARGRQEAPAPRDGVVVVLGDFTGPDSVLSLAVREALRARLANTSGVLVMSDLGIRNLKGLMRLSSDSTLDIPELMAIATRGGAHIAITGSVLPIGAGAQVVVDVIDPRSGKVERTFAERPLDAPAILTTAERMGRQVGGMISNAPRDSSVQALPPVTTASLTALKSYAVARQMASRGQRLQALEHGERAVIHDSTFVLAHYLLGDLLWFLDEQSHSDAHLIKAYELRETVPLREQLIIRARYEQLVRDRPDSALAYWDLLRDASPHDVLAYEGRTWALRALGRHEEAAAAADTAMSLDPAAVAPNTNNAMYSWLAVGDTANALEVARRVSAQNREALHEARFYAALERRDFAGALAMADSSAFAMNRSWRRQQAHLARRDIAAARSNLDSLRTLNPAQFVPRALLHQGWAELALRGDSAAARAYARETLAWLTKRDISPPAVARISERTADLAARAGDEATVLAVIELVRARDRGRQLRSYVLAQRTLDAALAYVRRDFAVAADRARQARNGVYFWRSLITIVQLEADARRAAGQTATADSLRRLVTSHRIVDGDFEVWSLLKTTGSRSP